MSCTSAPDEILSPPDRNVKLLELPVFPDGCVGVGVGMGVGVGVCLGLGVGVGHGPERVKGMPR